MPDIIQMQSMARSRLDQSKLASFDQEVIEAPTRPLIHQEARFLLIRKGRGEMSIQSRPYKLEPGALVAVLPWQITTVTAVEEPLQYYLLVYHLDTLNRVMKAFYDAGGLPAMWMRDVDASPVITPDKRMGAQIDRLFLALRDELGMESTLESPAKPLGSIYVMNKLVELIVMFERCCAYSGAVDYMEQDDVPDRSEILRYMYAHCNKKLTLSVLSRVFYMSESSISAYITGITGLSFVDLRNEMRIGKTANYLLYTDFTVEELAEVLGYVDSSHISKVFSARVGMKINEYRKTYARVGEICKVDDSRKAYEIVRYIYRYYDHELTAQNTASRFGMSVQELNRVLMYQLEKNFGEYLNSVRVNRACELLVSTDASVMDIALEVGYHNAKTLTRNFVKHKLMTPQSFRTAATER